MTNQAVSTGVMIQYKDICVIDNGAQFHNVDLHIHSYGASSDVKDKTMTPEAIVDSAVDQGLSVIALTDHNSNANVQRAIDRAQEHYAGQILVLPGVEVTTAHGHLLVYFPPERTVDLEKFLSRLDLIGSMGEENTRTAKSMADTIAEAEKLAAICVAAHIDRDKTGFNMFAPGFQNWKKDIITSPGLFGLECDGVDALVWYSDDDEAGSAGAERGKMLAARQGSEALKARPHLAHVQGSDSHSMKRFENLDPGKPWTRVKLAELSFNALRVALVDPKARVRACVTVPHSFPRTRGLALTGGFLHEEIVHFSDNLSCLIGGRGTGKSTAMRALAYAFGINDEFAEYENCPDSVTVFCEDANGILYRYIRTRGGDIEVKAKEDSSVNEVPVDAFRVEYYGQAELAKIAEDPLKNPQLLQEFLDRHINLRDLIETEESLVTSLRENAGRLIPLETAFRQLTDKSKSLEDIEKNLKVAEDGNLREVVGTQSKLASEKSVRESVEAIATDYTNGVSLSSFQRTFDQILATAGTCTDDEDSTKTISAMNAALTANNAAIEQKELELNNKLKACAKELAKLTKKLKVCHQRMSGEVATKIADLKARGVATDISGLEALLRRKTSVATEIASVEQRSDERQECRDQRKGLRIELKKIRKDMTKLRKGQLKGINDNLARTIDDYRVFVKYDDAGITAEFELFMQEQMHGTYLQDNVIEGVCSRVTPSELADRILARKHTELAETAEISIERVQTIVATLRRGSILFELQALAKQPKPVITILTRSVPSQNDPCTPTLRRTAPYNLIDHRHVGGLKCSTRDRPAGR